MPSSPPPLPNPCAGGGQGREAGDGGGDDIGGWRRRASRRGPPDDARGSPRCDALALPHTSWIHRYRRVDKLRPSFAFHFNLRPYTEARRVLRVLREATPPLEVWRCWLTLSKPKLKPPGTKRVETKIW